MEWYVKVLKNYATFSGRAQRAEFWMFTLVNLLIQVAFTAGILVLGQENAIAKLLSSISSLYGLAVLIPSIAVAVRRLHDTNRSGWWYLIAFTIIGILVLIIFWAQDSDPGTNQYGPNPKAMMGR